MKITVWNMVNEKGVVFHNHIEDGWSDNSYPTRNKKAQKNMKWVRKYAHLINGVVVYA